MKKAADIDYDKLFEHTENLKKVLLVSSGRTGSDFFQSLLEGHSEILQFTGVWYFHIWWKEAKCKENLSDLINEFIWHTTFCIHIARFKSYHEKIERWHQLGVNKNEFFEVDIEIFKNYMQNILINKELNSKNFFLAVNLAYGLAINIDIMNTKILFYHIHHIEKLGEFKNDFPDFDVICTIREPKNTLVSGIEHWKRYDINRYNSEFFYNLVKRVFDEAEPVLQYTKNIKTLKLEDLHLFPEEVLKEFCRIYGIKFQDSMLESSYHGKKWWGDAISGKYLDGFNKNIKEKKWKDKLFFHDNLLIEFILEERLRHYGYNTENKMLKFYSILAFLLILLPMKYELKIIAYNCNKSANWKKKIVSLVKGGIFYVARVLLYFQFIRNKINKKVFLSKYFMQECYMKSCTKRGENERKY